MPELFVRCSTCNELGVVASKKYPWGGKDCPLCLGRKFVRYGTEAGHEHQWMYPSASFRVEQYGSFVEMEYPAAVCACGRTAAEVTV